MTDWSVFARQLALVLVPVLLTYFRLPPELAQVISGPMVEVLSAAIFFGGFWLVGWIVWIGQRRERPAEKIEAAAKLPDVAQIVVVDPRLANEIPSPKVTP